MRFHGTIGACLIAWLANSNLSHAEDIKVLSAINLRRVVVAATPAFEKTSGNQLRSTFASTAQVMAKLESGENYDLVLVQEQRLRELAEKGLVDPGTIVPIAKAGLALMVAPGKVVNVRNGEDFRTFMFDAKSVAYPNPTEGGLSGQLFAHVLEQSRMDDAVRSKTKLARNTADAVRMVEQGEADVGVSQYSEIQTKSLTLVPFPAELGGEVTLSGGLTKNTTNRLAIEFIRFLGSASGDAIISAARLKPTTPPRRTDGP